MKKRIAAVIAAGLMAFQLTATGTAFAATDNLGTQAVSLSAGATDACVFAGGIAIIQSQATANVWTNGTYLYCDIVSAGNNGNGNNGNGQGQGNGNGNGNPPNNNNQSTADMWTNSSLTAEDVTNAPLLTEVKSIQVVAVDGVRILGYAAEDDGSPTYITTLGTVVKAASFGGKSMTVDTGGIFEVDGVELNGYFGLNFKVTNTTFVGSGLNGKFLYATALGFSGSQGSDTFDASAVTALAPLTATGGYGNDSIKGGAAEDTITGNNGSDVLYGEAGNDTLDCSGDDGAAMVAGAEDNSVTKNAYHDQCWGGAGDDGITVGGNYIPQDADGNTDAAAFAACKFDSGDTECSAFDTVAPGDGYDYISGDGNDYGWTNFVYVDSSAGIDTSLMSSGEIDTTADFDFFDTSSITIGSVTGSKKADALWMFDQVTGDAVFNEVYASGGKDVVKGTSGADFIDGGGGADTINARGGDDIVRGRGGDDVLYGSKGDDKLYGGKGADQTWGGKGTDSCVGEVQDRCEFSA